MKVLSTTLGEAKVVVAFLNAVEIGVSGYPRCTKGVLEGEKDRAHKLAQDSVGDAWHAILFLNRGRVAEERSSEHHGAGGVTTYAQHDLRLESAQDREKTW
jgi:hypothetical protein